MKLRIWYAVTVILFIALVGSNVWWALRGDDLCDRFLYHEVVSPDGKRGIFLLYNNCGATTPYATQAVLWPADSRFPRSGYEPFLAVKELHDLQVHWRSNTEVEIVLPKDQKIYRQDRKLDGVTIIYR